MGVTNHLLTGMILQVGDPRVFLTVAPCVSPRFVKLVRKCRNFDRWSAMYAFDRADESFLGRPEDVGGLTKTKMFGKLVRILIVTDC